MQYAVIKRKKRDKFVQKMGEKFKQSIIEKNYQHSARITISTVIHYVTPNQIFKILRFANLIYEESQEKPLKN